MRSVSVVLLAWVSARTIDDVEVVLGNLMAQHHVLVSSFDPRKHEGACEFIFTQRWLRLHGQNTVDEHQRVAVAVVAFLIKAEKTKSRLIQKQPLDVIVIQRLQCRPGRLIKNRPDFLMFVFWKCPYYELWKIHILVLSLQQQVNMHAR